MLSSRPQRASSSALLWVQCPADRKHHLFTTHSVKKGLSCYDDKRYILDDNINTLAYGHYSLSSEVVKDDGGEMYLKAVNEGKFLNDYDGDKYLEELIELMDCEEVSTHLV